MLPVFIDRAEGGILADVDNNRIIDSASGIAVTSVGAVLAIEFATGTTLEPRPELPVVESVHAEWTVGAAAVRG